MFKLRKYHGDRVESLTYEKDNQAASVGIMDVGEYEFGAVDKETTTVTSGKIWVRSETVMSGSLMRKGKPLLFLPIEILR